MPTRYNSCPHCDKRIIFKIEMEDIDSSLYPAPFYLVHKDESCNKLSTFYVDSQLQVAYKELEKKKSITGSTIKTIETLK